MSNTQVLDMFTKDQTWLEQQQGMTPWDEGCRCLAERLGQWLETYSEPVCDVVVTDDHKERTEYMARLWQCLGYHWQQGTEENNGVGAEAVAERIQGGQGYRRGGRLGGDPMRDVVLALAMTLRDGNAPIVFEADYCGFSRGLAGKLNHRLADNPDEWWNDLLDFLAGYTNPPGKLERFKGRCALQNWLGTVLWNFLRRWIQREWKLTNTAEIEDMAQTHTATGDGVAADESLGCFVELIRQSLGALSPNERLLLSLVYLDGMKQKEAAAVLGIHPGNVTRQLQKAIGRSQNHIEKIAAEHFADDSYEGVLEQLTEDPRAFAAALCDALEERREEKS